MTLGELLHSRTLKNPAKTVLYCEERAMSLEELEESTTRLARWFLDRSLAKLLAGGDTVSVSLQERAHSLFGVEVREGYGMTEAVPLIFNWENTIRQGSLGVAITGVQVRIVDSDGRDVPEGEIGEIAVLGPGNCIGYWKDPQSTERLLRNGWMHTGDLACCDSDGYYWFQGRRKEIIVRGSRTSKN